MYRYGFRFYFDADGTILYQMGHLETTQKDFYEVNDPLTWCAALQGRDDVQVVQYPWGKYFEELAVMDIKKIDVKTMEPVFVHREAQELPNPETPLPLKTPLEEEVERLSAADLDNKEMINGLAATVWGESNA